MDEFASISDLGLLYLTIGHVNNIPTMQFLLEFPETLSQSLIIDWAYLGIPK